MPSDPKILESIFLALIATDASERPAALEAMCDGDEELKREVRSLLRFHEESGGGGALDQSPLIHLTAGLAVSLDENRLPPRPNAGGFTLQSVLGSGGMGVVYVAQQHKPRRVVALKAVRAAAANGQMLRRFEHEGELLARLQHPGIAQVYETGVADFGHGTQPYIAMELIRGQDLLMYVRARALNVRERLELVARLCDAVQHAHQRGVIHRDLKPANILVQDEEAAADAAGSGGEARMPDRPEGSSAARSSQFSSSPQPKILDFGVARAVAADLGVSMQTSAGQLIGTLPYMSPEQVVADPDAVDTRSDVYALGVIMYQLLADRLPHDLAGQSITEAARVIQHESPRRLGAVNSALRGDVETIVAKAIEKDREQRYQSAADLAADIRRHLNDEPLMARRASAIVHMRKFARRNKAVVIGVAAVFAVLTIGLILTWTQKIQADRASKVADSQRTLAEARLADAEAVRDFLRDMLQSVDPRADGRDVRVVEVLERAATSIERGFQDRPAIEASVQDALGNAYLSLALLDRAEPHLTRSLALNRAANSGDHVETARALHSLGSLRLEQGDFPAARALFLEGLAMRERLFTPPHRSIAESINALGLVLRSMGELDQAEAHARQAVAMIQQLVGPDDLLITAYNDDLARLLFARGKYDEAATLHAASLAIRRRELGAEHPDVALALNHFAQTQFVSGDRAGAERSLREALAINRKVMGERHTAVADTLSNLAVVRRALRDLDEAEVLVREALDMRRELLGDDHPNVATTINELANIVRDKGDPQAAETLYRQALETYRRSAGGEDNPSTAMALANLADVLAKLQRDAEARDAFQEALAIRRAKLPPGHPQIAETLAGLAALLERGNQQRDAEPLLREALEIRRASAGPDSPQAAAVERALGACLMSLQEYERAEELLLHSLQVCQRQRGLEHPETLQTRQQLVTLYGAWNKPERIDAIPAAAAPEEASTRPN